MTQFPELPFQPEGITRERWLELGDLVNALFATDPLPPGELKRALYPNARQQLLPSGHPKIVGVAGKPRSGKDVVADYLEAHFQEVGRVNFSDPIIQEVNLWLEPSGHKITQGNKSEPLYRSLLQAWGLARREENIQYWTQQLERTIQKMQAQGVELVVVCGVRAPSDLDLVEKLGGVCWLVQRPGNDYQAEHEIESSLQQIEPGRMIQLDNPLEGNLVPYQDNIRKLLGP